MNIFDDNLNRLKEIKEIEGLTESEISVLLTPYKVNFAKLEVSGKEYPAWRVVYNRALGPGKGGLRFHPDVSEDEVTGLSFWMALKNSLANLPYGGAKGGVKVDVKKLSKIELEELSREYVRKFSDELGQDIDIPAPDVYTNSQIMSWILDEFEKIKGHHEPGVVTGKPLALGGLEIRQDATAEGAFVVFKEMVVDYNLNKDDLSLAIQGFGNAGSFMAEKLQASGFKVVAVSDSSGGAYNESGLDIEELIKYKKTTGGVNNFPASKNINNEDLLELEVDVLVLAALENQITKDNASKMKAKFFLEIANGPIDYEGDKILFENNKIVIPDILANSGGVIASYFEWAQNRTGQILDNDYLRESLNKRMKDNWRRVYQKYTDKDKQISLRQSAYILAVKKIIEASYYRGRVQEKE